MIYLRVEKRIHAKNKKMGTPKGVGQLLGVNQSQIGKKYAERILNSDCVTLNPMID